MELQKLIRDRKTKEVVKLFDSLIASVRLQGDLTCASGIVDSLSLALLPEDIPKRSSETLTPMTSKGDGNCLFNSVSIILKGTDCLAPTLRLLTAAELYKNSVEYANHPSITNNKKASAHISLLLSDEGENVRGKYGLQKAILHEAKRTCVSKTWCSLLHLLSLANILQRNIISVYPQNNAAIRPLFHAKIAPFDKANFQDIYIMWTRDGNLDNSPGFAFTPNHFVPLVWRQKQDDEIFDDGDDGLLAEAQDIASTPSEKHEDTSEAQDTASTQSEKHETQQDTSEAQNNTSTQSETHEDTPEAQDTASTPSEKHEDTSEAQDTASIQSEKHETHEDTPEAQDITSTPSEKHEDTSEAQDTTSTPSEKHEDTSEAQDTASTQSEKHETHEDTPEAQDITSTPSEKHEDTSEAQDTTSTLSEKHETQQDTSEAQNTTSTQSETHEDTSEAQYTTSIPSEKHEDTSEAQDTASTQSEKHETQQDTSEAQDTASTQSEKHEDTSEAQDTASTQSEKHETQQDTSEAQDTTSTPSEKNDDTSEAQDTASTQSEKHEDTSEAQDTASTQSEKHETQQDTSEAQDTTSTSSEKNDDTSEAQDTTSTSSEKNDDTSEAQYTASTPSEKHETQQDTSEAQDTTSTPSEKHDDTSEAQYATSTPSEKHDTQYTKGNSTAQQSNSCDKSATESFGQLLSFSLNIASGIDTSSEMDTDISSWDTDDEQPLKLKIGNTLSSEWDTDDEQPLGNSKQIMSTPIRFEPEDQTNVTEICMPFIIPPNRTAKAQKRKQSTAETLSNKKSKTGSDHSDSDSSDIELPFGYSDSDDDDDGDDESLKESNSSPFDASNISWKKPFRAIKKQPFNGPSPGSKLGLDPKATELDYFFSFFPESMLEEMAISTNTYVPIYEAKRRKTEPEWTASTFKPVTIDEIKAFLGVQMVMGINVLPSCDDYWSSDLGLQNVLISQTMSRARFRELKRYFHVRDPTKDPSNIRDAEKRKQARQEDPLYKIQTLLDHVRQKCRDNYHLHEHVSIDEAMVKFHGRHWGVVGAPNKPAKRGFKIFTLADGETGYMADFDVYLRCEKQVGSSQKVVEGLTSRLQGLNHVVYVDKYYTSIPLAMSLLSTDIYVCGSFNHVRKGWPTQLKPQKKLSKKQDPVRSLQRGQSISYQSSDGKMLASVWKDSSLVSHLTTCYSSSATIVSRNIRDKEGRWKETELNCPSSIKEYNKYMGGVDRHDHLRSNYTLQRTSSKWWLYFAWFAVDIALVNGFLSYAETHPKVTHKKFHMEVAKQLIGGFTQKVYRSRQQATTSGAHLDADRAREHLCIYMTGRARVCKQCTANKVKTRSGRTRETKYGCEQCMVNLHRECFQAFHDSKVKRSLAMSTTGTQTMATPTKEKSATPTRRSPRKLRKSYR